MNSRKFREKYGPWALITGASQGIGESFARIIAQRGINPILVSRRKVNLDRLAEKFQADYKVEAVTHQVDLTNFDTMFKLREDLKDYNIGLLVNNAAVSSIGSFFEQTIEEHDNAIALNCQAVVHLTHHFGNLMKKRKKGGIIFMSSLTAFQGSPVVANYGATKAFNLSLAEALWNELKPYNVDVKACVAGATATPAFLDRTPITDTRGPKPKVMGPDAVAEECLRKLHRNKPFMIPGTYNKVIGWFLRRIVSRKFAIKTIGSVNRKMYGEI